MRVSKHLFDFYDKEIDDSDYTANFWKRVPRLEVLSTLPDSVDRKDFSAHRGYPVFRGLFHHGIIFNLFVAGNQYTGVFDGEKSFVYENDEAAVNALNARNDYVKPTKYGYQSWPQSFFKKPKPIERSSVEKLHILFNSPVFAVVPFYRNFSGIAFPVNRKFIGMYENVVEPSKIHNTDTVFLVNPSLKSLGFDKLKTPFEAHQMISQFVDGVLPKEEKQLVKISNDSMIKKHGFDLKSSFRHRK